MKEFYQYWEIVVKPIIRNIVSEENFNLIIKVNNNQATSEEEELLETLCKNCVIEDLNTAYYVGLMASDIESSKFSRARINLINSLYQVENVLSHSGTFYKNVWNNEINTDFRKNVYELGSIMPKLTQLFTIKG